MYVSADKYVSRREDIKIGPIYLKREPLNNASGPASQPQSESAPHPASPAVSKYVHQHKRTNTPKSLSRPRISTPTPTSTSTSLACRCKPSRVTSSSYTILLHLSAIFI